MGFPNHTQPMEDFVNKIASIFCMFSLAGLPCMAQHSTSALPDAPSPAIHVAGPPLYSPPTQSERFKNYVLSTFGPFPIVEAVIRGGIQQERDNPSEWPQGGQGYADRFGSAMGEIAVQGTTEYVLGDLLKEDLRVIPCGCSDSKFKVALADTFTARRGEDGHRSLSIARMVGPVTGTLVAYKTWYPSGTPRNEIESEIGLSYGFVFLVNLIRESTHH